MKKQAETETETETETGNRNRNRKPETGNRKPDRTGPVERMDLTNVRQRCGKAAALTAVVAGGVLFSIFFFVHARAHVARPGVNKKKI